MIMNARLCLHQIEQKLGKVRGEKSMIKFTRSLDFIFIADHDGIQKQWCFSYGEVLVRRRMEITRLKYHRMPSGSENSSDIVIIIKDTDSRFERSLHNVFHDAELVKDSPVDLRINKTKHREFR